MKDFLKSAAVLMVFIMATTSCYYDNRQDVYQNFPNFCDTTGLRYTIDIKPIVDVSCANPNCHSPAGGQQPLLNTIDGLKNNEQKVRTRINLPVGSPGKMPLGGTLSDCNIDKIDAWFDDGAPN